MGHNSWKPKVERIERSRRDKTSAELDADAIDLVNRWNADLEKRKAAELGGYEACRRYPQFSPTIGAAIRAKKPFLRVLCHGCKMFGDVNLRRVVRPPDFPVTGISDVLVCQTGCRGQGPAPEIVGLFEGPADPFEEINRLAQERLLRKGRATGS